MEVSQKYVAGPGPPQGATIRAMLDRFFGLHARGTTVHREPLGVCLSYYVFGLPH